MLNYWILARRTTIDSLLCTLGLFPGPFTLQVSLTVYVRDSQALAWKKRRNTVFAHARLPDGLLISWKLVKWSLQSSIAQCTRSHCKFCRLDLRPCPFRYPMSSILIPRTRLKERANTLFAHAQLPDGFVGKLEAYQVKPVKWSLE